MNQSRRNSVFWRKQISSINGFCLKRGQISHSLQSGSPRNQRVPFHLTSFLNLILLSRCPQSKCGCTIHYIDLNQSTKLSLTASSPLLFWNHGSAAKTLITSTQYRQHYRQLRRPRRRPARIMFASPQFPFGSYALSSSGIWSRESTDLKKTYHSLSWALYRRNQAPFHALTLQDFNEQFPVFIKLRRLVKLLMNENVLPAAFLWAFSPLFHSAMGQPGIQTGGRK